MNSDTDTPPVQRTVDPTAHSSGGKLAALAIRYPVTICMLFVSMLVFGIIAATKIPLVAMPSVDFPFLGVWVPYSNATPLQIQDAITKPIEDVMATIPGVQRLGSRASKDMGSVDVFFGWGHDVSMARAEVRDKLDQIRGELPDDIRHIYLRNFGSDDRPVLVGQLSSGRDLRTDYELLDLKIKRRLERIPGVGEVDLWGAQKPQVDIYLRVDDLKRYRVNIDRLFRALDEANVDRNVGKVEDSETRFAATTKGSISSVEELEAFPLNERGLVLGDIAEIHFGLPPANQGRHLNGEYAVGFAVKKASEANTVDVVDRVIAVIEELERDPSMDGINLLVWFNQGEEITKSLTGLLSAGLYGAVLAVIVLFVFVRRLPLTLIIGLAIPFSIIGAVGGLYALGYTLNVLTMMGLMLSTGMLVDNAVVVLESIYQKLERGMERTEAARVGTSQVSLAVLASTLTSIIIFVPLIFGQETQFSLFLKNVGVAIIFALLCSLFISLTLIPLAIARLIRVDVRGRPEWQQRIADGAAAALVWFGRRAFRRESEFLGEGSSGKAALGHGPITKAYLRMVAWPLRHRFATGLLFVPLLIAGSVWLLRSKVPDNTPDAQELEELDINYAFSENYHYAKIERDYVNPVEAFLEENRDRFKITNVSSDYHNNWARTEVYFDNDQVSVKDMVDIRRQISEGLPVIPGAKIHPGRQEGAQNENRLRVNLYGDDPRVLTDLATDARERLLARPGFDQVFTRLENVEEEVQIRLDRARARKYGVSPEVVAGALGITVRGRRVRSYRTSDGEVDVVVSLHPDDLGNLEDLKSVIVGSSPEGNEILLGQVASFQIEKVAAEIRREDRRMNHTISAMYSGEKRDEGMRHITEVMNLLDYPLGYGWTFDFWTKRMDQSQMEFVFSLGLALFMVYFVMASLFESLAHPFAIMFSLPFGIVGVAGFLYVTGTPFNMISWVGLLVLVGIVVNNGIVLIDHINNLRRAGMPRTDAIREGCRERLRPIVMTATTTIVGLIPLAVGDSSLFDMKYFPMARTIMGGLMASTALTLVVLPTYYTLFDDLANWGRRVWRQSKPSARPRPLDAPASGD